MNDINWDEMDTEPGVIELEIQQQLEELRQQAEEAVPFEIPEDE